MPIWADSGRFGFVQCMPVGGSEQYGPRQHSGEIFVLSLPTGLPFLHSDAESQMDKITNWQRGHLSLGQGRNELSSANSRPTGGEDLGKRGWDARIVFSIAFHRWIWNSRALPQPRRPPSIHFAFRALTIPGGAAVRSIRSRNVGSVPLARTRNASPTLGTNPAPTQHRLRLEILSARAVPWDPLWRAQPRPHR